MDAGVAARDATVKAARRSARRLRRLLVGVAAALVVALLAGVLAVAQRRRADDAATAARVEALVGRAESLRATQRDTAALLAVEANRLADTPRTRSALLSTFTNDEGFLDAHRFAADRGGAGIVAPDGESAYLAGPDGHLRPYDLDSGALGAPLPAVGDADDPLPLLAVSPDGTLVAEITRSGAGATSTSTIGVIDTTSRSSRFRPVEVDGRVEAATFSTAGDRLAVTIGDEAALVVLDATTGIEVASAPGVEPADPDDVYVRAANLADGLYFAGPASGITTVGDVYVVGSIDGSVRLFDVETTALRATVTAPHNTVSLLHAAGDGTVVTAGRIGLTRIDLASETVLWHHAELEPCRNLTVVASRDSSTAVIRSAGSSNGTSPPACPCAGSTPRTATAGRSGPPATAPSSSPSASTNPSSPAGASTDRDRSPTSSPPAGTSTRASAPPATGCSSGAASPPTTP